MENKFTTALKIASSNVSASTLKIIRKYRSDSFANIKDDIINGKSFLSCNSADYDDYRKLLLCYRELIKNNVSVQIYENGDLVDTKSAYNWLQSLKDTKRFVESDDSWLEEDSEF